ncbi:hypothetical protein PG994_013212 [Apiospora phragmitis]|uniref:DUF1771 domain-containing protein n=1 Tax=Apiospora phragmitis TaxID=2905665 RepID=A0ABR1T808_9PEZI
MAKDSTSKKDRKGKGKGKEAEAEVSEKPLPTPRPGTSGTENVLITNRRQASEQFQKAARAEKAYRAKKHATAARANYNETKAHFKEARAHFARGCKGIFTVVRAVPYLVSEKQEARRRARDQARRQRDLERKKKLEEALARQNTVDDDDRSDMS